MLAEGAGGRCLVMGILNLTPDSFYDGGRYNRPEAALLHARAMLAAGADIIDVGGESTRPGSRPVTEQEELDRVIPVIERLGAELDVAVSIDTSKPGVMNAAVQAGAAMINDVAALRAPDAVEVAARLDVPVCLMHMQGHPATMQKEPAYSDVLADVRVFLRERVASCLAAGIDRHHIILDPGFGFGKTLGHNLSLLRALPELVAEGWPLLVGFSRKSMIGQILGDPAADRLAGSLMLAMLAVQRGARILRVHDVAETMAALKVLNAVEQKAGQPDEQEVLRN